MLVFISYIYMKTTTFSCIYYISIAIEIKLLLLLVTVVIAGAT